MPQLIEKIKPHGFLILAAMPVFCVLIALGSWQLKRLDWKNNLQKKIDARISAAPIPVHKLQSDWQNGIVEPHEFYPVMIKGTYLHAQEKHLYALKNGKPGWRIITPLRSAHDTKIFMIDRGFAADRQKEPDTRKQNLPAGQVSIAGILRLPQKQKFWLDLDNNPAENQWFWRDLQAMSDDIEGDVAPFFIEEISAETRPDAPFPGPSVTKLRNRHLEYALTWYGLAATLFVMVIAMVVSRQRNPTT